MNENRKSSSTWQFFTIVLNNKYCCYICKTCDYKLLHSTHTKKPFYGSLDSARDNPGETVPEETFTHSHLSWSLIIYYLLHTSTPQTQPLEKIKTIKLIERFNV